MNIVIFNHYIQYIHMKTKRMYEKVEYVEEGEQIIIITMKKNNK